MVENLPASHHPSFEDLKKINPHGAEYWTARELQSLLGYKQWRSFEKAIQKAVTSCKQSGNDPGYHFARARKMITVGKGAIREVDDFLLSRFAKGLAGENKEIA